MTDFTYVSLCTTQTAFGFYEVHFPGGNVYLACQPDAVVTPLRSMSNAQQIVQSIFTHQCLVFARELPPLTSPTTINPAPSACGLSPAKRVLPALPQPARHSSQPSFDTATVAGSSQVLRRVTCFPVGALSDARLMSGNNDGGDVVCDCSHASRRQQENVREKETLGGRQEA
jgi:hypothetical protein